MPEIDDYLAGHVQEALAADPRVQELGLKVVLRADRLVVSGAVSTPERQAAVPDVVAEVAPSHQVVNDTTVAPLDEPETTEAVQ